MIVVVIIVENALVHVTGFVVAAVDVHVTGKAVVNVHRAAHRHGRLRHQTRGRRHIRDDDHRALPDERQRCHKHELAGKPSNASPR
jgi:hypothetical protein